MNETKQKRKSSLRRWVSWCPLRHLLTLIGLGSIGAYFALRENRDLMQTVSDGMVRPWHRTASRLCSHVSFSVAELLIAIGILAGLVYIIFTILQLIRKPQRLLRIYRFLVTCLTVFALIYGGF